MKRLEATNSYSQATIENNDWTPEQDAKLKEESKLMEYKNWKIISKRLQKHFSNKHFSANECKRRIRFLDSIEEENRSPWTPNEELLILMSYYKYKGKWGIVPRLNPRRRKVQIRRHFYEIAREIAKQSKKGIEYTHDKERSPLNILKIYLCAGLFLDCLQEVAKSTEDAEIKLIVKEYQLTKKECLIFLNINEMTVEKARKKIEDYNEQVIEILYNRFLPHSENSKENF